MNFEGHGGDFAAAALQGAGVEVVFTLSGGHLFPLYDGCVTRGIRLVDTRHEQTAVFAALGWAMITGRPGVAALTAGPGITNGVTAMGGALRSRMPVLVIGGRAPQGRWGSGSLQEMDHRGVVAPVTKWAATAESTAGIGADVAAALTAATSAPQGPAFLDVPMDVFFGRAVSSAASPPRLGPQPQAPPEREMQERPHLAHSSDAWPFLHLRAPAPRSAVPESIAWLADELRTRLEADAVVVDDDAGLGLQPEKGLLLDGAASGCRGVGPGFGLAARLACPDRQIIVVMGANAVGYAVMDFDTLVRHDAPVVALVLNDGNGGRPVRYDLVVAALGGHGEMVEAAEDLGPTLDRAFASRVPALLNVAVRP